MKKKVNGVVVDIDNIELFKLAYEGKLLNKKASSKVKDTIEDKSELVRDLVKTYCDILDSLVFPLNMVENVLKYTMIALVLKHRMEDEYGDVQMQVDTSICVEIEDGKILRLLAGTWSIESTPSTYKVTRNMNLDFFKSVPGYKEYKWAYEKLLNDENTDDFYCEFMSDFVNACKSQDIVLKWELSKILDFGYVPKQALLVKDKITDLDRNLQYYLDVYCTGRKETNDNVLSIITDGNGLPVMETEKKKIKVYNFEVYEKGLDKVNNQTKKVEIECLGMGSLFDILLSEGIDNENVSNISYTGLIEDNILLFEVNKEIYISTFKEYTKPQRIISNVNMFAFESNRLYVKRRKKLYSGIYEETIYSYELNSKKARLCKIGFSLA